MNKDEVIVRLKKELKNEIEMRHKTLVLLIKLKYKGLSVDEIKLKEGIKSNAETIDELAWDMIKLSRKKVRSYE